MGLRIWFYFLSSIILFSLFLFLSFSLFAAVFNIPVVGHVNALSIGRRGRFIAAAVGQEHRLGRWERIQPARCGLHITLLSSAARADLDNEEDIDESNARGADESSEDEENEQFIMG